MGNDLLDFVVFEVVNALFQVCGQCRYLIPYLRNEHFQLRNVANQGCLVHFGLPFGRQAFCLYSQCRDRYVPLRYCCGINIAGVDKLDIEIATQCLKNDSFAERFVDNVVATFSQNRLALIVK